MLNVQRWAFAHTHTNTHVSQPTNYDFDVFNNLNHVMGRWVGQYLCVQSTFTNEVHRIISAAIRFNWTESVSSSKKMALTSNSLPLAFYHKTDKNKRQDHKAMAKRDAVSAQKKKLHYRVKVLVWNINDAVPGFRKTIWQNICTFGLSMLSGLNNSSTTTSRSIRDSR